MQINLSRQVCSNSHGNSLATYLFTLLLAGDIHVVSTHLGFQNFIKLMFALLQENDLTDLWEWRWYWKTTNNTHRRPTKSQQRQAFHFQKESQKGIYDWSKPFSNVILVHCNQNHLRMLSTPQLQGYELCHLLWGCLL